MGNGIIVCGLNGCGKSTVGKALAEAIGFYFIDHEELCFGGMSEDYIAGHSRREMIDKFKEIIIEHPNFILAAVNGMGEEELWPCFQYAVWIRAPKSIREQRVRDRSFQRFGNRMRPGGDLYVQEEKFFQMVSDRTERDVDEWLQGLTCPIIQIDGTKPVRENITLIMDQRPQGMEAFFET
ncbi:MAG: AAA family ATPase [Clostridiales bacterium]|nr:AAA family ATPase [Clostridiales bacterium]